MAEDDLELRGDWTNATLQAECPECGRTEKVASELHGRAWILGHLHAEHAAALPAFEGVAEAEP